DEDRSFMEDAISFTRKIPSNGTTPYRPALEKASELFSDLDPTDTNKRVLVFLTDGLATDKDPQLDTLLTTLKGSLDVEIIVAYYNETQSSVNDWRGYMTDYYCPDAYGGGTVFGLGCTPGSDNNTNHPSNKFDKWVDYVVGT